MHTFEASQEDAFEAKKEAIAGMTLEPMPVDKVTSFSGRLHGFAHRGNAAKPESSRRDVKEELPLNKPANETTGDAPNAPGPIRSPRRGTRTTTTATTTISQTTSSTNRNPIPSRTARSRRTPNSLEGSKLTDTIPANLTLLLVGVNPGIMTGLTGYSYAHPTNQFWKLLYSSGITTKLHPPSDTYKLPQLYNVGNTNVVERPTRDASMLSRQEMLDGVPILQAKIREKRPQAVCLVGKGIWEYVFQVKFGRRIRKEEFKYGWQDPWVMGDDSSWGGARIFVATTTSGVCTVLTRAQKEVIWAELGEWVKEKREAQIVGS